MKIISILFTLLVSAGIIMFGCKKHNISSPLSYTYNMAGMHVWTGIYYGYTSGFTSLPDTIIGFSKDSSTITVINDTTIISGFADTMKYFSSNYKDTIIFKVGHYSSSTGFIYDTLWYNYLRNVITLHIYLVNTFNPNPYIYINEHTP